MVKDEAINGHYTKVGQREVEGVGKDFYPAVDW